eukprot:CAMPEP_0204110874 /NCGR_PEP_ID=MMETSP0361-20130328/2141_1 /ASSEMBLY_ACC=CAM_ASM_000343 /TAXON_ID=268821 /ORGANISM="Scrippsiella Hangoei, Strain SHTV-5" /LENGTH=914 /DNA_ID=CAMNT_0051060855 /DNA_START=28 /DNA_END=2773 /DNA_ORIENTATION=+
MVGTPAPRNSLHSEHSPPPLPKARCSGENPCPPDRHSITADSPLDIVHAPLPVSRARGSDAPEKLASISSMPQASGGSNANPRARGKHSSIVGNSLIREILRLPPAPTPALGAIDIIGFLSDRGLPEWLLASLQAGSRKGFNLNSLRDTDLAQMGIRNPLHQRRVLREIQEFIGESLVRLLEAGPSGGCDTLDLGTSGGHPDLHVLCSTEQQRPERLDPLEDMRWPYLQAPSSSSSAQPCRVTIGSASDEELQAAADATAKAEALDPAAHTSRHIGSLTAKVEREPFIPQSNRASRADVLRRIDKSAKRRAQLHPDDGIEDACLDRAQWVDSRMHPSGVLSILDVLHKAAVIGDLEALAQAVVEVEAQGGDLVKSLETMPCMSSTSSGHHKDRIRTATFPDGPNDFFWGCVLKRLTELRDAEAQLVPLNEEARDVIAKVRQTVLTLVSVARYAPKACKRASALGGRQTSVTAKVKARKAMVRDQVLKEKSLLVPSDGSDADHICNSSASRHWVIAQQMALKVHGNNKSSQLAHMVKYVHFTLTQERLIEVKEALKHQLQAMVHLISSQSRARRDSNKLLKELELAEHELFNGFLRSAADIEYELREAATLDKDGRIDMQRMRKSTAQAQKMVGARTLLGDRALQVAQEAGFGYDSMGEKEREPPDPWSKLKRRSPPWEASFLSAVKMLQEEQKKVRLAGLMKNVAQVSLACGRLGSSKCRVIKVLVVGARNLQIGGSGSTSGGRRPNPYCTVEIEDRSNSRRSTHIVEKCSDPRWDWSVEYRDIDEHNNLIFQIWDKDDGSTEDHLGATKLFGTQILVGFSGELLLSDTQFESYLEVHTEATETDKVSMRQSVLVRDRGSVVGGRSSITSDASKFNSSDSKGSKGSKFNSLDSIAQIDHSDKEGSSDGEDQEEE